MIHTKRNKKDGTQNNIDHVKNNNNHLMPKIKFFLNLLILTKDKFDVFEIKKKWKKKEFSFYTTIINK